MRLLLTSLTLLLGACAGVERQGAPRVISLGPWPEAGDTEAGRGLPEYRELARVLGPHLYRPSGPWSPYFPEDIWQRWARRFLD